MRGDAAGLGTRALVLLGTLLTAATAHAQGTITSGDASFVVNASHFDTSPAANLIVTGTEDHLFESGWWFRMAGDPAETAFPAPDSQTYVGDTATFTWLDVGGRGFGAEEVSVVSDGGGNVGQVVISLTVTNPSTVEEVDLDVFHMADVDVNPTASNDAAVLTTPNSVIDVTHASNANTVQYLAVDPSAFLVRAFGAADVAAELSNASVSTFDSSGLRRRPVATASTTTATGSSTSRTRSAALRRSRTGSTPEARSSSPGRTAG